MNTLFNYLKNSCQFVLITVVMIWPLSIAAIAQTTTFTYQGRLSDAGNPANGIFDMQFVLYDTAEVGTGTQQGETVMNPNVEVANGAFSVPLDFGPGVFDGSARYIEIGVRPAGNKDPYTILSPRQPVSSTPYAIRSTTAGTADTATDATQLGGLTSDRFLQFDANDNIGIGTPTPLSKLTVQTAPGNYGLTHTDGTITIGTYVGGSTSGATGGWLGTFSNHDLHLFTNNGQPSMTINTVGNVGIGTSTPFAGVRLDVNGGSARVAPGNGGAISFGTPNIETGMIIQHVIGANRADVRFDGSTLKLVAGGPGGPPSNTNGVAIDISGNVGIGTASPKAKFHVSGGSSWFQGDSIQLPTTAGKGIVIGFGGDQGYIASIDYSTLIPTPKNLLLNNSGGSVGINAPNPSRGRLQVEGGDQNGVVAVTNNPSRYAIYADGNAGQARDKGGWVKSMLYVTYDSGSATIVRCYDSITNTSNNGCVTLASRGNGIVNITFPFQINDRFISLTPLGGEQIAAINNNSVTILVGGFPGSFFIFVY